MAKDDEQDQDQTQQQADKPNPKADQSFDDAFAEFGEAAGDQGAAPAAGVTAGADKGAEPGAAEDDAAVPGAGQQAASGDEASGEGGDQGGSTTQLERPETVSEEAWKDLNEKQRAEVVRLDQQRADADQRARSDAGRVSALNKELDRARRGGGGPTQEQLAAALKDPDSFKKLQDEYPEIATAMSEFVDTRVQRAIAEVNAKVEPIVAERDENARQAALERRTREYSRVDDAVEGWREIVKSTQFADWIGRQPPVVQQGMKSQSADDAIHVLKLFKAATKETEVAAITRRRENRLNQAASVTGSSRAALGRAQAPNDFNAAWDFYDRQDQQRRPTAAR